MPFEHQIGGDGLAVIEWPSGALEFRRKDLRRDRWLNFFVVSAAERTEFMQTLEELSDA